MLSLNWSLPLFLSPQTSVLCNWPDKNNWILQWGNAKRKEKKKSLHRSGWCAALWFPPSFFCIFLSRVLVADDPLSDENHSFVDNIKETVNNKLFFLGQLKQNTREIRRFLILQTCRRSQQSVMMHQTWWEGIKKWLQCNNNTVVEWLKGMWPKKKHALKKTYKIEEDSNKYKESYL